MSIGEKYAEYVSGDKSDEEPPLSLRAKHWVAHWVAYRPILDKIGLKRAKNVYTGGGPLGEDHFQYYHALGVPLKQIWGQSEVCGFVTMHRDGDIDVDTVGEVFPNVEVGITTSGELLVRGPVVTSGYYNQPEKTESAPSKGWLHTDDFGALTEDGHVKVFDRMDDVLELADGTPIAPISVETKLKFNPISRRYSSSATDAKPSRRSSISGTTTSPNGRISATSSTRATATSRKSRKCLNSFGGRRRGDQRTPR